MTADDTESTERLREELIALIQTDVRWMRDQFDKPNGGVMLRQVVTVGQIQDLLDKHAATTPSDDTETQRVEKVSAAAFDRFVSALVSARDHLLRASKDEVYDDGEPAQQHLISRAGGMTFCIDALGHYSRTAVRAAGDDLAASCECPPCPGRGNDGHGMTHCAECCFGSGVEADIACQIHGDDLAVERDDDEVFELTESDFHTITENDLAMVSIGDLREAKAAAWDEGYETGMDDEIFNRLGMSTDSDAREYPHVNPYREAIK